MDFSECKEYTFDEKILYLLSLLESEKHKQFEKETGISVKKKGSAIQLGSKVMPDAPEEFTFALVELLQKNATSWKGMSEKQRVDAFKDLFLIKTQKYSFRDRRKLFALMERVISEKRVEEFSVIKNGELVDFKGLDFERAMYADTRAVEKGPIVWKKNAPPPSIYDYI